MSRQGAGAGAGAGAGSGSGSSHLAPKNAPVELRRIQFVSPGTSVEVVQRYESKDAMDKAFEREARIKRAAELKRKFQNDHKVKQNHGSDEMPVAQAAAEEKWERPSRKALIRNMQCLTRDWPTINLAHVNVIVVTDKPPSHVTPELFKLFQKQWQSEVDKDPDLAMFARIVTRHFKAPSDNFFLAEIWLRGQLRRLHVRPKLLNNILANVAPMLGSNVASTWGKAIRAYNGIAQTIWAVKTFCTVDDAKTYSLSGPIAAEDTTELPGDEEEEGEDEGDDKNGDDDVKEGHEQEHEQEQEGSGEAKDESQNDVSEDKDAARVDEDDVEMKQAQESAAISGDSAEDAEPGAPPAATETAAEGIAGDQDDLGTEIVEPADDIAATTTTSAPEAVAAAVGEDDADGEVMEPPTKRRRKV